MKAAAIVVGLDCSFGYQGAGNAELLRKLAASCGYSLYVIEKEQDEDRHRDISSTYIREELACGNVAKANELLGEPYAIHGKVVHGNHIGGAVAGFPTANLIPPAIKRLPRYGVYVSRVLVDGVYYQGVTKYWEKAHGRGRQSPRESRHISWVCNWDIYGSTIEMQLLDFIRGERKFDSLEELKEQISRDKEAAAGYFEKKFK